MKKFFFLLLLNLTCSYGQEETNNWYFGDNASINFDTSPPTALSDSKINTKFGCASISDNNGILQFYTNSTIIFNRDHKPMLNSNLNYGSIDSDQNSIIIKKPNSSDKYLLFTMTKKISGGPITPPPAGLYCTEIDMTGDNGLGIIVSQNVLILSAELSKISAVHHADGKSIWLLTTVRNENEDYFTSFYTFKINENSIIEAPIISSDAINLETSFDGIMKFSPNGKHIAISDNENPINLYNFDNQTGEVISQRGLLNTLTFFEVIRIYGIEFSNDSNFLYATAINERTFEGDPITPNKSFIYQYDLKNPNPTENLLKTEDKEFKPPTSLQLAKDGKIYRSIVDETLDGTNFLGVINTPNKLAQQNYINNYIELSYKQGLFGLPNFVQSYFRTRITTEEGCATNPILFETDTYTTITEIEWDFGDGNTINQINPQHTYTTSGNYFVTAFIKLDSGIIVPVNKNIIIYQEPSLINNQKLTQCDTDNDGISLFNLNNINNLISTNSENEVFTFYETLNDAENDTNEIEDPINYNNTITNQEIFVRATNENGCYSITSFFLEAVFINLGNISSMYVCEDSDGVVGDNKGYFNFKEKTNSIRQELNIPTTTTLRFYPSFLDAQRITNELQSPFVTESTTIWLRADTVLSCGGIQSFKVFVNTTPIINLNDKYIICINPIIKQKILEADISNEKYEWRDSNKNIISNNRTFELNTIGTYSLTVYKTENNIECSNTHTFEVLHPDAPIFSTVDVISNGGTNSIYVNINGNSSYEFSSDGINFLGNSTSHTFDNVLSGIQTIYVRDIEQCEPLINSEISIIGYPNFFTPNNDGNNDTWFLSGVDLNHFSSIDVQIYNRYGKHLYTINNNNYLNGWDGFTNGKPLPASTYWFSTKLIDIDGNILEKKGNISLIR